LAQRRWERAAVSLEPGDAQLPRALERAAAGSRTGRAPWGGHTRFAWPRGGID